ncbi:hypothetical protein SAMD00023353_0200930 [Rosellinia necatrix]|uniref:Uncharacterized protein n=1 Tax=Rosellinia necatrix TaxID=77044 RepID=A0A1S8A576_ROSNE|nr:hypothetical protein SAMD00023353_0200930 [Rosellinia necatrix]
MLFTSKRPRRLVVCDTGMVGMGCPYVKTGDKICVLAGCTSAVVLRRRRGSILGVESWERAYEVVGSVSVCLSEKDGERLLPFIELGRLLPFVGPGQSGVGNGLSWYETEVGELRRGREWQEFILV